MKNNGNQPMELSLPMPKVGIENPGVAAPGFLLRVQMDTLLLFAYWHYSICSLIIQYVNKMKCQQYPNGYITSLCLLQPDFHNIDIKIPQELIQIFKGEEYSCCVLKRMNSQTFAFA